MDGLLPRQRIDVIRVTKKELIAVAKEEMTLWEKLPLGIPMAILWAFIHRVTTGETIEETFFSNNKPVTDYQI